jgi:hypothetical protein
MNDACVYLDVECFASSVEGGGEYRRQHTADCTCPSRSSKGGGGGGGGGGEDRKPTKRVRRVAGATSACSAAQRTARQMHLPLQSSGGTLPPSAPWAFRPARAARGLQLQWPRLRVRHLE